MTEDTWAELHRLRVETKGPDGFLTWKEAATAERLKRVAAEQAIKDARKQALEDARELFSEGFAMLSTNQVREIIRGILK